MKQWDHLNQVLDRFVENGVLTGCGMQIIYDGQMVYSRNGRRNPPVHRRYQTADALDVKNIYLRRTDDAV